MMRAFLLSLVAATFCTQAKNISMSDDRFLSGLSQLPFGQKVTLSDVSLGQLGEVSLSLTYQQVFAENAKIVIHSENGVSKINPPLNKYFSGHIEGIPESHVFLSILENGVIEGVVSTHDEKKYVLKWQKANQFKLLNQTNSSMTINDSRWFNPSDYLNIPEDQIEQRSETNTTSSNRGSTAYQLTVAIETDFEFYSKFNNTGNAVNYIAGLLGYISSIYSNEIDTSMLLGETTLWETSNDPWDSTSTECALYEVGKYWNDNKTGVDRALTHFISGKSSLSGIAWVGVLCYGGFNYDISESSCDASNMSNYAGPNSNYGGGYGVSSGLSGTFNPNNPQVMWDSVVVSHEIGHNFNSPHTHCYEGIGGNNNPVDECNNSEGALSGCYAGSTSLPGPIGQGSGTIMSYCHLLSGGLSNITLTLGKNHNYGVQPERVPNQMRAHVESRASLNPQCIVPLANDFIFYDGFEG